MMVGGRASLRYAQDRVSIPVLTCGSRRARSLIALLRCFKRLHPVAYNPQTGYQENIEDATLKVLRFHSVTCSYRDECIGYR